MQFNKSFRRALILSIIFTITIFTYNIFAEIPTNNLVEIKNEENFWQLDEGSNLESSGSNDGLSLTRLEYQGIYRKNISGSLRNVLRLSFDARLNENLSKWSKLILLFPSEIDQLVDWDNSYFYKEAYPGYRHDYPGYEKTGKFEKLKDCQYSMEILKDEIGENRSGPIEVPIDLVLKEGVEADQLFNFLLQFRISDENYKNFYTINSSKKYNDYTFASNIDFSSSYKTETASDLRGKNNIEFDGNSLYGFYNKEKGSIDIICSYKRSDKYRPAINQKPKAFRQVMDENFYKILGKDDSPIFAEIVRVDNNDTSKELSNKIEINKDDFYIKDKLAFLKIGPDNFKEEFRGENFSQVASSSFNKIFLNNKDDLTIKISYFIDKDKLEKSFKDKNLIELGLHTSLLTDFPNNIEVFELTTQSDYKFNKGEKIEIDFGSEQFINGQEFIFINGENKINLRDSLFFRKKEGLATREVDLIMPFDLIIKSGDTITVKSQSIDNTKKNIVITFFKSTQGTGNDRNSSVGVKKPSYIEENPRIIPWTDTYSSIILAKTENPVKTNELFTDGNLSGFSSYENANIYISKNGEKIKTKSSNQAEKIIIENQEITGYKFSHQLGQLEKDSPIYISNKDNKASFASQEVEEIAQARVKFDLNGGSIRSSDEISFEGYNEDSPVKDFSYKTLRSGDTDPIIRIAPRNIRLLGDENYLANGFEGENASTLDHQGNELQGQALELRKFVKTEPEKNGFEFVGWSTKKLDLSLEEDLKAWQEITEAESLDQVNDKDKAYKFIEKSPISKDTEVYAVYKEKEMKDKDKYQVFAEDLTKDINEKIEEDEVINLVKTDYPDNLEDSPNISILGGQEIPDCKNPGEYKLKMKILFPDTSEKIIEIKIIVKDKKEDEKDPDIKIKPGEVVLVEDINNLSQTEKDQIKNAIRLANPEIGSDLEIRIDDKAGARIFYKDKEFYLGSTETVKEIQVKEDDFENHNSNYNSIKVKPAFLKDPISPTKEEVEKENSNIKIRKAYINGYADGSIKADANLTRAEAASMLAKIMEIDIGNSQTDLKDIDKSWAKNIIASLAEKNIMKGYEDGTFRPDQMITRAEFAEIIKNIDIKNQAKSPFIDISGHWAEKAINQAYANNRINGYEDGTFRPDNKITRAEAVKILNSVFDYSLDQENSDINIKDFTDLDENHWAYYEIQKAANDQKYIEK
ncbi:S-layer homology domain-containing protein [Peptoniphilus obesi]|uniref:S-layer homology domain-containing protein n=1 Tax=Peptoniphilus obesi TaxID=1472765 RepID=UPI0004AD7ABA|nr:S-layer homology domain-containing protein [Peptoniphilus obesi]